MQNYNAKRGIYEPVAEGDYQVIVPALLGIITYGRTLDGAREMARDAIVCHLQGLIKDHEEIPDDPERRQHGTIRAMQPKRTTDRSFKAKLEGTEKGRVYLVLPFDPEKVWGSKERYHVSGTINGKQVRGSLERFIKGYFLPLGPAYRRDAGLRAGDVVTANLWPEGPQREALAPDITAALEAEPEAARFFDALATFYRKNYLRWIDATKRSPETRAQRIAQLVELMQAGQKERPR